VKNYQVQQQNKVQVDVKAKQTGFWKTCSTTTIAGQTTDKKQLKARIRKH